MSHDEDCTCDPDGDFDEQQWTVADVAAHWNIKEGTVRAYMNRRQMPPPDGRLGRTPWWHPETIREHKRRTK